MLRIVFKKIIFLLFLYSLFLSSISDSLHFVIEKIYSCEKIFQFPSCIARFETLPFYLTGNTSAPPPMLVPPPPTPKGKAFFFFFFSFFSFFNFTSADQKSLWFRTFQFH